MAVQPASNPFADMLMKAMNPAPESETSNTGSGSNDSAGSKGARPKPTVYLNIGMNVPMEQPDGTVEDVFVSLPFGLGVDTMSEAEYRGSDQNSNWNQLAQAKNGLLAALKGIAEGVEPGKTIVLPDNVFQLEIRKVGKAEAPAEGSNPMLAAIQSRLSVVK